MPDLVEMKVAGEMMVVCNPCRHVFMRHQACPKCGKKWKDEVEKEPEKEKFDYKKLMMNPEPVMADWEKEVAKIGKDRAMAVEERAKHVKFEVEMPINIFIKGLHGDSFQMKVFDSISVGDLKELIHERTKQLMVSMEDGDEIAKAEKRLFDEMRFKLIYEGQTLDDCEALSMYGIGTDSTIKMTCAMSGEGSIRFICCFVPFCFHFK